MFRVFGLLFSFTLQVMSANSFNHSSGTTFQSNDFGMSDFKTIITTKKNTYVDKTLFIKDVMTCPDKAILMTRPPGFGKTLALSTLKYFFSAEHKDSELFSSLAIMKTDPGLDQVRHTHMENHTVIHVDLSNVRGLSYNESYSAIQGIISREFLKHNYVVGNKNFLTDVFESVLQRRADEERTANSINWLCGWISAYYNGTKTCVVLIDGYDTPVHTGFMQNHYESIEMFMKAFLSKTVKTNTHLEKAVITGVIPLAGGVLPDNVVVKTVFDDAFLQTFGYTQQEVNELAQGHAKGAAKKTLESIDTILNGYNFGGATVFNPRAVTQYLFEGRSGGSVDPTSEEILVAMLAEYGLYPVLAVQQLVAGENVTKVVAKHQDLTNKDHREPNYWAYMLHAGYLTVLNVSEEKGHLHVTLRVPNLEIRTVIATALEKASGQFPIDIPSYTALINDLVTGNFASAQTPLEHYLHYAGEFIDIDDHHVPGYLEQILRGVELRYGTKIEKHYIYVDKGSKWYYKDVVYEVKPKDNVGVPVRIYVRWANVVKIVWYKLKKMFCPIVKKSDKNQEIMILYSVFGITSCVRSSS